MKSGQVLTDRRYKWFEPEYWRFGDPASAEGQINYMRHASGQVPAWAASCYACVRTQHAAAYDALICTPACLSSAEVTCTAARPDANLSQSVL